MWTMSMEQPLLDERAAVEFWQGVVTQMTRSDAHAARVMVEDGTTRIA
jgi:hypothetical protein